MIFYFYDACILYKFHVINNNGAIALVHALRKIGGNIGYPDGMRDMKYYGTQNSVHQRYVISTQTVARASIHFPQIRLNQRQSSAFT